MKTYQMYLDGAWVDAADGEIFESLNPYTGTVWAMIPRGRQEDADRAVIAADRAFRSDDWAGMTPTDRGHLLRRLGDLIAENAEALARIEVTDNGKLFNEMSFQLRYIPQWFHYYAGLADKIEGAVIPIDKPDTLSYTRHEPLGVCVGITAWNSPLLLLAYKVAPALAAGNTFIAKPSEFTSASTLEFARLVDRIGFPKGVFNVVTGLGAEAPPLSNTKMWPRSPLPAQSRPDVASPKSRRGASKKSPWNWAVNPRILSLPMLKRTMP